MPSQKLMRMECCILSLLLDSSNFDSLYIDGKIVNKILFNGEKIYDNSKWFAIGNKFTSTNITAMWGGSSKKLCNSANESVLRDVCIGNTSSNQRNTYCCGINENRSEFTDLGAIQKLSEALVYLPIDSFSECKNIYHIARFNQTTYEGDLLIKPFIRLGGSISSTTKLLGTEISGIGNKSTDNTDEGLSFTYLSAYKGKTVDYKVKLSDNQVATLDFYKEKNYYPNFLCKAFKTDNSTTTTKATAYYAGYLLLEI